MRPNPKVSAGFTLVELMVTVSVIMLLAGLLVPSVKAIKDMWDRNNTQWQLNCIKQGIWTYASDDRVGATIPASNWTLRDTFLTGAESLCYFMIGPQGSGFSVEKLGVPQQCGPYYVTTPEEIRKAHDGAIVSGGNWMGLRQDDAPIGSGYKGRVFVDRYSTMFEQHQAERTRPVLFFAATDEARTASAKGNPYTLADNELIIKNEAGGFDWAPSNYASKFDTLVEYDKVAHTYLDGIVLMSAGQDRVFFTDDDILDLSEKLSE